MLITGQLSLLLTASSRSQSEIWGTRFLGLFFQVAINLEVLKEVTGV